MTQITIEEAEKQLAKLIEDSRKGEQVIITIGDGSNVAVRLQPIQLPNKNEKKKHTPNLSKGAIIIGDDFFDELPDEFWLGEDA